MRIRLPTPADLPALAALLSTNECLCVLGRAQARPEWVTIGEAYVANVLRTEYASFENCMARYESPASKLWALESTDTHVQLNKTPHLSGSSFSRFSSILLRR